MTDIRTSTDVEQIPQEDFAIAHKVVEHEDIDSVHILRPGQILFEISESPVNDAFWEVQEAGYSLFWAGNRNGYSVVTFHKDDK